VYLDSVLTFIQTNQLGLIIALALSQLFTWIVLVFSWRKNRKLTQSLQSLPPNTLEKIDQYQSQLVEIKAICQELTQLQSSNKRKLAKTIQHVGFYRYNAFPDTGGELSFSLALLNEQQEGFVLTSLYSRQEARVYAKEIHKGSLARLSPEEQEAIRRAIIEEK